MEKNKSALISFLVFLPSYFVGYFTVQSINQATEHQTAG
jgi:hypothetical protein